MQNNFMEIALKEARNSEGDIPIGCIITKENEIIAKARNTKEKTNDPTAHAEINAIRVASKTLKNWRLCGCDLYVTLEPCPMCAWAILSAGIKNVYFGAYDLNYGAFGSKINLATFLNFKTKAYGGIMEHEAKKLLDDYFKKLRL